MRTNIVASCCMFLAVFCTTDKKQVTPLAISRVWSVGYLFRN